MRLNLFLLLTLLSCSLNKTNNSPSPHIDITITQVDVNKWKIDYELDEATDKIVFFRQTNQFREKNWSIEGNPNLIIKNENGKEVIKSIDGSLFKSFTIIHETYTKPLEKDYEFFINFSNNDLLMFTGHYQLKLQAEHRFNFITLDKNKNIIIDGKVTKKKASWVDKTSTGTYVFWRYNKPTEQEDFTVVIDESVPNWIKKSVYVNLPKLFKLYERKLSLPLGFKPVVYLNTLFPEESRMGVSGGALPGLIQLSITGSTWKTESKGSEEWLLWFLAHESAHLWNSQAVKNADNGEHAWMHEGSAEAFAFKALLEFGLINNDKYADILTKEKAKCIKGTTDGSPLYRSSSERKFKNYYTCGHSIAVLTENSINGDIFLFWKQLLNEQLKKNGKYDDKDYFRLWRKLSKNQTIVESTERFVYEDSKEIERLLIKE